MLKIKGFNIPSIIMLDEEKKHLTKHFLEDGFNDYIIINDLENIDSNIIKISSIIVDTPSTVITVNYPDGFTFDNIECYIAFGYNLDFIFQIDIKRIRAHCIYR